MSTSDRLSGFLLDDARCCSSAAELRTSLDILANFGINTVVWHFSDDQGCRVNLKAFGRHARLQPSFTVAETRGIVSHAKSLGIDLIPELASLGHSRFITALPRFQHLNEDDSAYSGMCPVHPETRVIVSDLLKETMDIFDSPAVHVGLDEVNIGLHPLTKKALERRSKAAIIADHISFLREVVVTQGGREMWMWGDGLLASPALMQLTPKDIVVCNWQYRPDAPASSTRTLLDAGFEVIAASGLLTHDQTFFPSDHYAIANVRNLDAQSSLQSMDGQRRVRGHIVTTWIPCRSITQAQYLGWHMAAQIQQHGAEADSADAIESFGRDFYGLPDSPEWKAACATLFRRSPERREWMQVLKLQTREMSVDLKATLPETAHAFETAAEQIRGLRSDVRQNESAFDAFQLLLDVLAHAYTSAAYLAGLKSENAAKPARLQQLLERRTELLAALSDSWDRERFADDPAKTEPVIHYFRDDHLLLVVRDGLDELERRTARLPEPVG